MSFIYANNVNTTLAAAISSSATTLTLSSTTNLPTLSAGQMLALTLNDVATQEVFEIVYVTAISGASLTVQRGREGTTAVAWNTGDYAYAAVTAAELTSISSYGGPYVMTNTGLTASQVGVEFDGTSGMTFNVPTGSDGYHFQTNLGTVATISAAGLGTFAGVDVGGALTGVTTADFTGIVTGGGAVGTNGVFAEFGGAGSSSHLVYIGTYGDNVAGVVGNTFEIGYAGAGPLLAFDASGDLGIAGTLHTNGSVLASGEVSGTEFVAGSSVYGATSATIVGPATVEGAVTANGITAGAYNLTGSTLGQTMEVLSNQIVFYSYSAANLGFLFLNDNGTTYAPVAMGPLEVEGQLVVTSTATFESALSAASLSTSGALSAASGAISGALTVGSLNAVGLSYSAAAYMDGETSGTVSLALPGSGTSFNIVCHANAQATFASSTYTLTITGSGTSWSGSPRSGSAGISSGSGSGYVAVSMIGTGSGGQTATVTWSNPGGHTGFIEIVAYETTA